MAPATGPSQIATRHRTTHSRKLLSGIVGCEVERQPIEPKNLYHGHRHTVSRRGDNASAADHLWMAGGDRRLKHSILGELAGPSGCRCPRIFRLHAEQVARTLYERSRLPPGVISCSFVFRSTPGGTPTGTLSSSASPWANMTDE